MGNFEILFLGTCACDYSPLLQTTYKDSFDKNARRSSCALVNGKYLIDCGHHCMDELRIAKADVSLITDVFITHLHGDHYSAEHLQRLAEGKREPLRVWVKKGAALPDIPNVEIKPMEPREKLSVAEGITVTGLAANHDAAAYPQHLLFEINGKRFFYGCDGAWFLSETYYALKNAGLDLLVLDGTCGDGEGEWRIGEHNTLPMIRLMLPSLRNWGAITEKTQVYISHLAPSLHLPHEETAALMGKDGVKVAYDGLRLEI